MDEVYQGQNKTISIRLRDGNDDPWDLTGKQIIAQLKLNNVATNISCAIDGNAILGKVSLVLTDVQTAQLKKGDLPIAIYVGTYAAAPTITPATDTTDQIFNITGQVTVLEPKI